MNQYETEAAVAVRRLAEQLPQTVKIVYEAKGIVGGDFKVIVKRVDLLYDPGAQGYEVEVEKLR